MGPLIVFVGVFGGMFLACLIVCVFSNRLDVRRAFGVFSAASVVGLSWNLTLPLATVDPLLAEKPKPAPTRTYSPSEAAKVAALVHADRLREIILERSANASSNSLESAIGRDDQPGSIAGGL